MSRLSWRVLTLIAVCGTSLWGWGCSRDSAADNGGRSGSSPTSPATQPQVAGPTATAPASAPDRTSRRVHVFVSGNVQGVGFRAFTQAEARKLKLTGFVMNLTDGRVEAVIEGPSDAVNRLLGRMRQGPPGSRVDRLDVKDESPTGEFADFAVRR